VTDLVIYCTIVIMLLKMYLPMWGNRCFGQHFFAFSLVHFWSVFILIFYFTFSLTSILWEKLSHTFITASNFLHYGHILLTQLKYLFLYKSKEEKWPFLAKKANNWCPMLYVFVLDSFSNTKVMIFSIRIQLHESSQINFKKHHWFQCPTCTDVTKKW
jgi:hypothetical protein